MGDGPCPLGAVAPNKKTASGLFFKLHFTLKTKKSIQVYNVNCKQQGF
jgi:hypothetical protein